VSRDDDARLVENLRRGVDRERSARILYERYFRLVFSYFTRRHFNSGEAADLTQDVFLRVFRGIEEFRGDAQFSTWLLTVARSVYFNELRRRHADMREGIEESLEPDSESSGPATVIASPDPDPLDELLEKEARDRETERLRQVQAVVRKMPPQMRRCFLLRYVEHYKYREIAVLMKLADGTVKALLHQARAWLKRELGDLLPGSEDGGEEGS
jgi:RNA polymerase sigma-70 factor (ECF subfamily)